MRAFALFTRRLLAASVICLCGLTTAAWAEDLHVNNLHGSDDRNGRVRAALEQHDGPVFSLTRALAIAEPGDRIVIADTGIPYRESVTLSGARHSGTSDEPFVISGNGAVLEGSLPIPEKMWEHYRGDVFRFRPTHGAFAQLFLDGPPAVRRHFTSATGRLPTLAPREWCFAGGMIYFRVDEGKLPLDYGLAYAALPVGVTLYQVHDVVIEDLTVQGFQLDGVNAADCAVNCELLRLIARGNGRAGVAVGGASRIEIKASLMSDNGAAQILTEGPSQTAVLETEIDAATAPALTLKAGRVLLDGALVTQSLNEAPAPAAGR